MERWTERTRLLLGDEKLGRLRSAHVLVVGLGGYALLDALFSSSWQRETRNAAEENRMLYRNGRILQMKKFRKQRRPCPRE